MGIVNFAKAQSPIASGDCGANGNNLTWVLTSDSVLTVSGQGNMKDYSYPSKNPPWYSHNQRIRYVVIGDSITKIGDCAFVESDVISLNIPNSVTSIGYYAFSSCSKLISVTIGSGVGTFSLTAFSVCKSLTAFDVNANNQTYASEDGVLFNKTKTTLLRFPQSKADTDYIVPNSVTIIEESAFESCTKVTKVTIPNSVTNMKQKAFYLCKSLISANIGNGITTIKENTFNGCSGLLSVSIPNSVTRIKSSAFSDCSGLLSATIGSSVDTIDDFAFSSDKKLAVLYCKTSVPPVIYYSTFSSVPKSIPVHVPCGSIDTFQNADYWKLFTNFIGVPDTTFVFDVICQGEMSYNGYGFTVSGGAGTYYRTESGIHCNSVICLTLTEMYLSVNISVTKTENSFQIAWQGEADSYEIYRNNDSLTTVSTTHYDDTDLIDSTEYCYKIRAISKNCKSDFSDTVCMLFERDAVGIIPHQMSKFVVYPNPANDKFTFDFEGVATIKLYDMLGQQVVTQTANGKIEININHLPKGVYTVRIFSENRVIGNSKIIKK